MPQIDPSATFTEERTRGLAAQPILKIEIDLDGDDSFSYEEKHVLNTGTISRSSEWDTLKFSPGGSSIEIDNTDGRWSDTLGNSLAFNNDYNNKKLRISIGFKLPDGSEEYLPQYEGIINKKTEDLNKRTVTIQSFDIFKRILNVEIAKNFQGSEFFEYENATEDDQQGIQTIIAMGKHELPSDPEIERRKRNPFNLTECIRAVDGTTLTNGTGKSRPKNIASPTYYDYGDLWLIPIANRIDTIDWNDDFYFYDYINSIWVQLAGSSERLLKLGSAVATDPNYQYWYVTFSPSNTQTKAVGGTINWDQYIAGTGIWSGSKVEPAIAIKTTTNDDFWTLTTPNKQIRGLNNPACQIYYLLISNRIWVDPLDHTTDDIIDQEDFMIPDHTYSFDKAYTFLQNNSGLCFTNFKESLSLLKAIEQIAEVAGLSFYSTQPHSSTINRQIKLQSDLPSVVQGTCSIQGTVAEIISSDRSLFSAKLGYGIMNLNNKVSVGYFDYTKNNDSDKISSFVKSSSTSITLYEERYKNVKGNATSGAMLYGSYAGVVATFYLNRLSEPEYTADIVTDFITMNAFVKADLISLVDESIGLNDIFQIKSKNTNFNTGKISLVLTKLGTLFGPDPKNQFKKWAFVDCAYVDNDGTGGSGNNGSVSIGNNYFILSAGDTFSDAIMAGMGIRVGTTPSTAEYFRILEVISQTEAYLDSNASAAFSTEFWTAGTTYHIF